MSLIFGEDYHIFEPNDSKVGDEAYDWLVFLNRVELFGPLRLKFQEILNKERLEIATMAINHVLAKERPRRFCSAVDRELGPGDREFICRIMRLEPRERPTAKELLEDEWLEI